MQSTTIKTIVIKWITSLYIFSPCLCRILLLKFLHGQLERAFRYALVLRTTFHRASLWFIRTSPVTGLSSKAAHLPQNPSFLPLTIMSYTCSTKHCRDPTQSSEPPFEQHAARRDRLWAMSPSIYQRGCACDERFVCLLSTSHSELFASFLNSSSRIAQFRDGSYNRTKLKSSTYKLQDSRRFVAVRTIVSASQFWNRAARQALSQVLLREQGSLHVT